MAALTVVGGVVLQIAAFGPFVAVLVPLLVLALLFSLLFEIRNNTRRTAEALERLADRDDGDDEDGVYGLFD
jgi:uncharacterized membrane protein